MKLTKDILKEIILEVISEQEDEEKEKNESLILKIKEELKKYEI